MASLDIVCHISSHTHTHTCRHSQPYTLPYKAIHTHRLTVNQLVSRIGLNTHLDFVISLVAIHIAKYTATQTNRTLSQSNTVHICIPNMTVLTLVGVCRTKCFLKKKWIFKIYLVRKN